MSGGCSPGTGTGGFAGSTTIHLIDIGAYFVGSIKAPAIASDRDVIDGWRFQRGDGSGEFLGGPPTNDRAVSVHGQILPAISPVERPTP
jgi:hypothetical protein